MTESADADEQVPVEDLTPEEASRIIHSHRKVRYGKETSLLQSRSSITVQIFSHRIRPSSRMVAARLMQLQGPRVGLAASAR
jgi:hypothetical protein